MTAHDALRLAREIIIEERQALYNAHGFPPGTANIDPEDRPTLDQLARYQDGLAAIDAVLLGRVALPAGEPAAPAVQAEPTDEEIGHVTIEQARTALDSMDDFARMRTSVDAMGPRRTLEVFIAQVERAAPTAQPAPQAPSQARTLTEDQMLDCVRSVGVPAPMGLTRDSGPYEVTEPTWFLIQLVRAIERAHGIQPANTKD